MTIARTPVFPIDSPPAATTSRGHAPTLAAAFLHFDLSFMIWVLLGALGVSISEGLGLDAAQKGLVVAIPLLSGSLLRIPVGLLSDRLGGKRVGTAMLLFLYVPLLVGWRAGDSLPVLLGVGLMLGVAGASFAVALPLAGRWYPPERQGLVMGVAAAGNSGTVVASLLAPRLAASIGWHNVLAAVMIPLTIVLALFVVLAREPAHEAPRGEGSRYRSVLARPDLWWLCLFYSVTFGGYVGLSSFMSLFLRDQYHVSSVTAGSLTALAALAGSGFRPIGGYVADRLGGTRLLSIVLAGVALSYLVVSRLPALPTVMTALIGAMVCLGIGNGAVFQIVPQCFRRELGIATGVVGAVGGLGGFVLPTLLGQIKQSSGSFQLGFVILGGVASLSLALLRGLAAMRGEWRTSWIAPERTEMPLARVA